MKTLKLSLLLLMCIVFNFNAQTVDTISVFSEKMQREIKNVVILPQDYDKNSEYPVLYLLHGYGGNYRTWIKSIKPTLPQEASKWGMIIVCPDGQNSWYWDSPINSDFQFETYVSTELVKYIDSNYSTVKSTKGRAITGLSMGGHGGLWLGINHQDVYGACGSMSGGVDIRPFPKNWDMKRALGPYNGNQSVWDSHTVIERVDKIVAGELAIIIDCGVDDFFYEVNQKLHDKLAYNKIPHDYIVRPGIHNNEYWNNAIDFQLLFFSKFFNKK